MSNHTTKMNQTTIEIKDERHFFKFGIVKPFETLQTVSNVKMNIFQIKIFKEITLLLFVIYTLIKFKILVSLPKSFHCPFDYENILQLANWECFSGFP